MSKDLVIGTLVTCAAVTACALVPIAGLIGATFIPVPLIYYRVKSGPRARAIALATGGYLLLLAGALEFFFFGTLLAIGVVMGELLARRWPLEKMAAMVSGVVLAMTVVGLWMYSWHTDLGMLEALEDGVQRQLELTLRLYHDMGLPEDQLDLLEKGSDTIRRIMIGMLPAIVISSTLISFWVCLLVARLIFQRQGLPFHDYGALDLWRAPEMLVWGVIASGVLLLVPSLAAKTLGLNGIAVFTIVYFFQGIGIVAYFLNRKRVPRVARVVLYGLIAFQQILMLAVAGVGFFDTWFNFRKIGKPLAPA